MPAKAKAIEAKAICQGAPWLKAECNTEIIRLANGSTIRFTFVDGPLESEPVTGWLILDDPYKNPAEAASSVERERVRQWFFGTALGRIHQKTSVMVCHHRWTVNDLIPEVQKQGYIYKNYPALDSNNKSLWEEFKSSEFLLKHKAEVGMRRWLAIYQGDPQPEGGRLFSGTWNYTQLPIDGFSIGIGIDCAYSTKPNKQGDWSAIVVMYRKGDQYYIKDVQRVQEPSPAFEERLARVLRQYKGATCRWYPGPSELGLAQRLAHTLGVEIPTAKTGKKLRAEDTSVAWNKQNILIPRDEPEGRYPWVSEFIDEVHDFTGVEGEDLHDDQVDALAAAFDTLSQPTASAIGLPGAYSSGWSSFR
jgi:predicted phage terminase large subunit-like protein